MRDRWVVRVIGIWLSLWLAVSPWATAFRMEISTKIQPNLAPAANPFFSSQWVVLVPDVFDTKNCWERVRAELLAGGILPGNIVLLSSAAGYSPRQGLAQQAEVLEQVLETGRAQRGGIKAHVIARGSGGLVTRWLQMLRREHSPVQAVMSMEEPGQGLWWAQAAYILYIPLPRVGAHAPSVRDLAPGSQFLQRVHQPDTQARALLRASRALQKEIMEALQGPFRVKLDQQLRELDQAKQELGQKAQVWARFPEQVPLDPRDAERVKRLSREAAAMENVSTLFSDKEAGEINAGQLAAALERIKRLNAAVVLPKNISIQAKAVSTVTQPAEQLSHLLAQAEEQLMVQIKSPDLYPILRVPATSRKPGQVLATGSWQPEEGHVSELLQSIENRLEKLREGIKPAEIRAQALPAPGQAVASAQALDALQAATAQVFTAALATREDLGTSDAKRQVRKFGHVSAGARAQGLAQLARVWENTLALRQAWEDLEKSRRNWLRAADDWNRGSGLVDQALLKELEQTYTRYALAKQNFYPYLQALEKTPADFPSLKLELETIRIYFNRCDEVEPKVMQFASDPEAFREALGCLESGGAASEREMFAQTLTKQLGRELGRLEHEAVHPETQATASAKLGADARRVLTSQGAGAALTRYLEQERGHQALLHQVWEALHQRQALARQQYQLGQVAQALTEARTALVRTQAANSSMAQIARELEELAKQGETEQVEKQRAGQLLNTSIRHFRESGDPGMAGLNANQTSVVPASVGTTNKNISEKINNPVPLRGEGPGEGGQLLRALLSRSAQRRERVEQLCSQLQSWAQVSGEFDWHAFAGKVTALQLPALQVAAVGPVALPQGTLLGDVWEYARAHDRQAENLQTQVAGLQAVQQALCEKQAGADNTAALLLDAQAQVQVNQISRDLRSVAAQARSVEMPARSLAQMENSARRREAVQAQLQDLGQAAGGLQTLAAQSPSLRQALAQEQKAATLAAANWQGSMLRSLNQTKHTHTSAVATLNASAVQAAQSLAAAPEQVRKSLNADNLGKTLQTLTSANPTLADLQSAERSLNELPPAPSLAKRGGTEAFFTNAFSSSSLTKRGTEGELLFLSGAQDRLAFLRSQAQAAQVREAMDQCDLQQAVTDAQRAAAVDVLALAEAQVQKAYDQQGGAVKRALETSQIGTKLRAFSEQREKIQLAVDLVGGEASAHLRVRDMFMQEGVGYASQRLESLLAARAPELGKALKGEIVPVLKDLAAGSAQLNEVLAQQANERVHTVVQAALSRQTQVTQQWLGMLNEEVQKKKEINQTWWDTNAAGLVRAAAQARSACQEGLDSLCQAKAAELRHGLQARAEGACDLAQGLLDQQVSKLKAKIAQYTAGRLQGTFANTGDYLRSKALAATQGFLNSQAQALENLKTGFTQDLEQQIAEIKSANAAAIYQAITQKYSKFDLSQLTKLSLSPQGRLNMPNWSSLLADNDVLQFLRRDAFAQILASNPALKEMQKLGDLKAQFQSAIAQGGDDAKKWFEQTQLAKHLDRLNELRDEAQNWLNTTIDSDTSELTGKLAESELGSLMKRWGIENQYLEAAVGLASDSLKNTLKNSGLMAEIDHYTNVKSLLEGQFNTLVADVQAYVAANAVATSLGSLSKDVTSLMDQLSGKAPLNLNAWISQVSAHLDVFKDYGAKFMERVDAMFARLSQSNDATSLFQQLQEQFTQFAENIGQGLQNLVAAAVNPGAWPDNILNFSSNPLANLGNYLKSINFSTDQLWNNLAGIIDSPNWKFDFSQNVSGLMQNLNNQVQKAMNWVGDRWADMQNAAAVITAGPERWLEELEKVDWKSVSQVADRFIPPQYQAAKSALDDIVFNKDYASAAESLAKYLNKDGQQYVRTAAELYRLYTEYSKQNRGSSFNYASASLTVLDLASDYLDADAQVKYQAYRVYAEDAVKYYGITRTIAEGVRNGASSVDWGSVINSINQLVPALQQAVGPVYTIGQGSSNRSGGTTEVFQPIQINQPDASAIASCYLDQAEALQKYSSSTQENLAYTVGNYRDYWAQKQAEYLAQKAALGTENTQGITDSGSYDSRVITGQMTDAQAQAERIAWNAGRGSGNTSGQGNVSQGGSNGPQNPGGVKDDNKNGKTAGGSEEANKADQDQKGKTAKTDYVGVALNAVAKSMFIGALMPDKQTAKSIGKDAAQGAETAAKVTAKGAATAAEIGKEKTAELMNYCGNQAKKAGKGIANNLIKAKNNIVTTDKKVVDEIAIYCGYGPDKYYDSVTKTVQTPQGNVGEVDMNLDYLNDFQNGNRKPVQAAADAHTSAIFANKRWSRATDLASDKIAKMIDDKQDNIIYVPGVNDTFMSEDNIRKMAAQLNIPKGCVLVIGHSAGSEAMAKAMTKTKRDRSEVYYLALSPRTDPTTYASYLNHRKPPVPADHVMSINSINDFPHKFDVNMNFKNEVTNVNPIAGISSQVALAGWHEYENRPELGTHVFLHEGQKEIVVGHSSMVEGLSNSEIYSAEINGSETKQNEKLPKLINDYLFKQ